MSHHIFLDLVIKTSRQKVFDAFSQPVHLNNWWTLRSSGKPEMHAEYNLNFTDQYDWYCKVSAIKPNELIYFKMTRSDDDWNPTTFGIALKEHQDGTLLEFSHRDWQENNHHFRHSAYCWSLLLKNLKDYLERGIIHPFETRN